MDARALVKTLLESDVDAKTLAMRTEDPYWEAAAYALNIWLNNLHNIDKAISDATQGRPHVRAVATSQVLDHYINLIAGNAARNFSLDDEVESDLRRMLMTAWQHERLGSKSSEITMLKQRLGESDEIDPKAFSSRLFTLDVNEIKQQIAQAIPGLAVAAIHVLKGMLRNEGENREFYVYLAREPRSDNGFDPENYPTTQEQRQADEIIKNWLTAHGCTVLETRMITSNAMYKNVSRCVLTKYYFQTDQGVNLVGHSNDAPVKSVKVKRGL